MNLFRKQKRRENKQHKNKIYLIQRMLKFRRITFLRLGESRKRAVLIANKEMTLLYTYPFFDSVNKVFS